MGTCASKRSTQSVITPKFTSSSFLGNRTASKSNIIRGNLEKVKEAYTQWELRMHKRVRESYRAVMNEEVAGVTDLNLKFMPLDSDGAMQLCLILPFYDSLLSLRLWKTRLGPSGCLHLSKALSSLPQLLLLSIEDNAIGPTGIKSLSTGLRSVPGLEEFFLHANNIQQEGSLSLAALVSDLPRLRNLTVDENSIGDQGAIELIRAVSVGGSGLKLLGLGYNKLTERTAREMLVALTKMRMLRKVTFGGATVGEKLKLELQNTLPAITFEF
jgi:hypothetical protein